MLKTALLASTLTVAVGWSCVRNFQLPMGPSRMNWGGTVFGHRGCRHVPGIPENTLDAFKYAVSRGCGGVECDVRLTRDNEVVVFHDAMANGQLRGVPATKRIDEFTLFELKECTYVEDPTEMIRVPTLEESVLFCRENNLRMLIEIKEMRKRKVCAEKVLDLYRRYPDYMYDQTTVISFDPSVLYQTRQRDRRVAVGQIYSGDVIQSMLRSNAEQPPWYMRVCPRWWDRALRFAEETVNPWVAGCSLICPKYTFYSEAYRKRWHSRKIAVYLWGFENSEQCTGEMRQPGVCVSCDDRHEDFATAPAAPDFDIFGDRQREKEREEEEQRKRLRLKQ